MNINENNFQEAKGFFNQITELTLINNENLNLQNQKLDKISNIVNNVGDIHLESKRISNDNLKLKNDLVKIVSDYKIKQGYLQAVFAERSKIIDKHFEIIDKGLKENNDDLILQGLRGASEFVSTNPLNNFENFKNILLDKNSPLELDF